ncbi:hypothetical protein AB0I52_05415 [Streptomyces sp. NPDC050423]|uniref:hypothetical protein n=1 Tax=Streptomyces sp. NPDC050423 TaxID=3155402 RepID=UPI00342146BE
MLDVVVHAMWGVREQSPDQLAERWLALLRGLAAIDGGTCGQWYEAVEYDETPPAVQLTESAVAAYIDRQNPASDADYIGRVASLSTAVAPGRPRVSTWINAGGSANRVPDSFVVKFRSRELDESVDLVRRSAEVMAAVGASWDADWGEVYNDDEYDAVAGEFGLSVTVPRGGRSVYLSPGRAALAPEGLPGTYTRTAAGGLVIDLTRGGTAHPSVASIVEANRELRAAGALEPLPVPFDRDRF